MPSTGNVFPATAENTTRSGATVWSNPANAVSDNTLDAVCNAGGSGSQYLVARNFGFALPGSAVNGITVRVELSEHSGGNETISVQLQNDAGVLFGTAKTFVSSGTGKIVYTVGGSADVWGATLTPTVVNHANFGVRIWFTTTHLVQIDYVTLAVEYVPTAITVALVGAPACSAEAGTAVAVIGTPPEAGGPFPGPIFPGQIFPGPIFPGTGAPSGDVTVALNGAVANVPAGTIVSAFGYFVALTGVGAFVGSGTTESGGIFPGPIFPGEIFPDPIFPSEGGGASLSGGVGIVIPATLVVPPAVVINGTVGFVSAGGDKLATLSGVVVNASAGTVVAVADRSFGLNGVVANAAAGLVARQQGVSLSGILVNVAVETLVSTRTLAAPLTGVVANAAAGQAGIFDIFPLSGAVATAQAGFVTGGTDKVANLTGVAVNATAGSVLTPLAGGTANATGGTVVFSQAPVIPAATATATAGTLVFGKALGLTGVNANVSVGILGRTKTVSLTGVAVTAAAGILPMPPLNSAVFDVRSGFVVAANTLVLVGVQANATATAVISFSGVAANAQAGFVTAGADRLANLTGVAVNAAAGTVALDTRSLTLTGAVANATVGTVAVADRSMVLSGVAVNATAGTTSAVADRTLELTGVVVNAVAYFVTTGNERNVPVSAAAGSAAGSVLEVLRGSTLSGTGIESTAAAGTLSAGTDKNSQLVGNGVSAAAGLIHRQSLALTGVGVTARGGSTVSTDILKTLPSVRATAKVGFTPKEGDIMLEAIGASAAAGGVGILGVGPPVTFGTNRHAGIRPARKNAKDLARLDREMELVED